MKRLFILGCGGHGKVIADIALKIGVYDNIFFLEDGERKEKCMQFPVVGDSDYDCFRENDEIIVAVGNSEIRQRLTEKFLSGGLKLAVLIHPAAVIGCNVKIGCGTVVMAGAVVNPDTVIGQGVIINTCASVDHDNVIKNYSHISVGAHTAGTVTVGSHVWIGAGAVVSNNIEIADNTVIGAGAVVVKNIEEAGTYIGVPAKKHSHNKNI